MLRVLAFLSIAISIVGCGAEEQPQPVAHAASIAGDGESSPVLPTRHDSYDSPRKLILQDVEFLRNGDLSPGLPIRFEPYDFPRLQELKQRENLSALVNESFVHGTRIANAEFETILRIKNWVAAQWPHSLPDPYPPWDAITVLDWIREGRTGGFCGQYSQVLLQSLASLGIPARYLEIGPDYGPMSHFVVEAWSNDFDKWVVLDADHNVHFERNGIPLSALELRDALLSGTTDEVDDVLGEFREGHTDPAFHPLRSIELYYYLRVMLKANHLSAPDEAPFDRRNDMVEWDDGVSDPDAFWLPYLPITATHDRSEFNAKLNQVKVSIESMTSDSVYLRFESNLQDLRTYKVVEVNPSTGHVRTYWDRHDASTYVWKPNPGYQLEVRAVGPGDWPGPPAVVKATFGPQ